MEPRELRYGHDPTSRPADLRSVVLQEARRPGPGPRLLWAHSFTVHAAQREETIGPGGNLPTPRLARHAP